MSCDLVSCAGLDREGTWIFTFENILCSYLYVHAIIYFHKNMKMKKKLFVLVLQQNYLAQVTSNIWGTKFKIVGLAAFLPTNLGAGNQ